MTRRLIMGIAASFAIAAPDGLAAQVRGVTAPRRDTVRARADTSRRDSTAADTTKTTELIKWNPTDSVMESLMARAGYSATRYQGDKVVFNVRTRTLQMVGQRAGVTETGTVPSATASLTTTPPRS